MNTKQNLVNTIINYFVVAVSFLLPIFFLPITGSVFEFNKIMLLSLATMLMLLFWVIKMIVNSKVEVVKSPLNLPMILFFVIYLIATIFSVNKTISIWGEYGRWFPSLYAISTLILFYYVAAINISGKKYVKYVLNALILGITLNAFIALSSNFGIFFSKNIIFANPNFNLLGSLTTTAILSALAAILSFSNILYTKKVVIKIAYVVAVFINFFTFALIGVFASWIVFIAGLITLVIVTKYSDIKNNKTFSLATLGILIGIVLITMLPTTSKMLQNENLRPEIKLPFAESWVISSSTIVDNPILGTGPSTFLNNFGLYKTANLNNTDYWNVRFDKPTNEIFNIISTLGLLGILVVGYFIYKYLRYVFNCRKLLVDDGLYQGFLIAIVATTTTLFVTYQTFSGAFVMFLALAMITSIKALSNETATSDTSIVNLSLASISSVPMMGLADQNKKQNKEVLQFILIVPIALIVSVGFYFGFKVYAAEYYIKKASAAFALNDGLNARQNQAKAIQLQPLRAEYRNAFAQTNLLMANTLSNRGDLTEQDQQVLNELISAAINSSRLSTEVINPRNPASWELRGSIYSALIGAAQDAERWSIASYNTAARLDPNNPRLNLRIGGVYFTAQDYLSAATFYRRAATLKPDYANAHYNLAQALFQIQNYPLALRELQTTLNLVDQESQDAKTVQEQIQQLEEILQQAQEQANQQPTIEDLNQQAQLNEQNQVTTQEPLTQPGANIQKVETQTQIDLNQNENSTEVKEEEVVNQEL